jgi:hypothetical protein
MILKTPISTPPPQLPPTQIATHHHLVCGQPGYGPVDVWLLVPVIEATTPTE